MFALGINKISKGISYFLEDVCSFFFSSNLENGNVVSSFGDAWSNNTYKAKNIGSNFLEDGKVGWSSLVVY